MKDYSIETKCVQTGYSPKSGEPRVMPIAQSTTYYYEKGEDVAKLFDLEPGYMYTPVWGILPLMWYSKR